MQTKTASTPPPISKFFVAVECLLQSFKISGYACGFFEDVILRLVPTGYDFKERASSAPHLSPIMLKYPDMDLGNCKQTKLPVF